MPTDRFNPSHEAEIHERLVEYVASDGSSEENIEELVVRLVETLDGQIELLVDPFHVCKCLRTRDVHLNHWTRWSRNIFRPRLPRGWRRVLARAFRVASREKCSEWTHRMLLAWDVTMSEYRDENSDSFRWNASNQFLKIEKKMIFLSFRNQVRSSLTFSTSSVSFLISGGLKVLRSVASRRITSGRPLK